MADETQDTSADSADLEALAERYLDLWQDQISAMAADPDFATALQTLFGPAAWGTASASSPLAAWQALMTRQGGMPGTPDGAGTADERAAKPGAPANGAAPGATAAAPAPDGGGADLDQLERRLAALEARIAALESGAAGGKSRRNGGGAQGGARRKRS